jgi:hypothetical protein
MQEIFPQITIGRLRQLVWRPFPKRRRRKEEIDKKRVEKEYLSCRI